MAAKRYFDEQDSDHEKRRRIGSSFASVVREEVARDSLQKILEPMIRRVVHEEVERGFKRKSFGRSNSFRIQAAEPATRLKLSFSDRVREPIFTGTKIQSLENKPLQILVLESRGDAMTPTTLAYPIKVEIVVLDGDFPEKEEWTSKEFEKSVVKQRYGKRPLLTGDLNVTMRDGVGAVPLGDIEFTDNSSWIRSRKFRIGARVVQTTNSPQPLQIQEAITQPFIVRDHRGELYKKHHPPMLEDEVWRLEKIGKDGAFHRKLSSKGINTVQDFLKLANVDQSKLKNILGVGMSEKMWEVTLKHAKECVIGNKLYIYTISSHTIILNPICQILKVVINGQTYTSRDLSSLNRGYIENLVRGAYTNWNSLQQVEGQLQETPLLTQGNLGDVYPNNLGRSYQQHAFFTNELSEGTMLDNADAQYNGWGVNSSYMCNTPVESGSIPYNLSESSSDGDELTPKSFFYGSRS